MTLFNSSNKNIIRSGNNKNSSRSTKTIISPNIYDAYSTQNNISREIKTNNEIIKRIRTKTYRVRRDEILKFKKIKITTTSWASWMITYCPLMNDLLSIYKL